MNDKGVIYKIENAVDGKVYIGQTVRNYKRRMYEHIRKLRKGYHDNCFLQNAWNKYGEKAFIFSTVVESCIEDLDDLEVKWISFYKEKGLSYNLESGGNCNKKLHESTKEKLSEHTKRLNWLGGKHPMARKVICVNNGQIYGSIIEASKDLGVSYGGLYNVLKRKNISARGADSKLYQFAYYKDGAEYKTKATRGNRLPTKVVCVTTGKTFRSMREAAYQTNTQQSHISLCCNGKREHAGKLSNGTKLEWKYA